EMRFRARPNLRIGEVDWPLFAIFGGLGTAAAWLVVVAQKPDARWVGFGWLALGLILYAGYRRYVVKAPLRATLRAPILIGPAIVREAERRQTEIIVLGAPRSGRPGRAIFSETVDYILKNAPCRVMVVAGKKVAAA